MSVQFVSNRQIIFASTRTPGKLALFRVADVPPGRAEDVSSSVINHARQLASIGFVFQS